MSYVVDPVIVPNTSPLGGTIETHPAYGMIGASRVTGRVILNGSDFIHHNFIAIRVHTSQLHRGLSSDHQFAKDQLVELHLSESQWARFVSSMNVGDGVPCTLNYVTGKGYIPEIAKPQNKQAQFTKEYRQTLEKALDEINGLIARFENVKVTGKAEILSRLEVTKNHISVNLDFVVKQFGRHIEQKIDDVKIEVGAFIDNAISRAGISAMALGNQATEDQKILEM